MEKVTSEENIYGNSTPVEGQEPSLLDKMKIQKEAAKAPVGSSFKAYLEKTMLSDLQKQVSNPIHAQRMVSIVAALANSDERFLRVAAANKPSLVQAVQKICSWQLDPAILNECYLIPYEGKNPRIEAQVGYKGLKKMAKRAMRENGGSFVNLSAEPIFKNDHFECELGAFRKLVHRPAPLGQPRGELIGFYAVAVDSFAGIDFVYKSVGEIQEHQRKFPPAPNGPFGNGRNFEAYGLKTVMRLLTTKALDLSGTILDAVASETPADDPNFIIPEYSEEKVDPQTGEVIT